MATTNGINSYRKNVTDRLLLLESDARGIKEDLARLIGHFDEFAKQVTDWRQRWGRPNWAIIASMAGIAVAGSGIAITIMIAALSVLWFTVNSQMVNTISPLKSELAAATSQISINTQSLNQTVLPRMSEIIAQNSSSLQDRRDQGDRLNRIQDRMGVMDNNIVANTQSLREVETQFRSNDQNRNIQFSEQQRQNSNFQNSLNAMKAPMPPAPTAPYYQPDIARDSNHN